MSLVLKQLFTSAIRTSTKVQTLCFACTYVSLKYGQNTRDQIMRGRVPKTRVINFSVHSIHS